MTKTSVIVQARMGSTRLPGKVLMPLGGRTVIDQVIRRCQNIARADEVCIATTVLPRDDDLVEAGRSQGALIFRGDEQDVLSRYYLAAREMKCDRILRVTSDCPLIDATVCDEVLDLMEARGADYACNFTPPSFPHGLDCEAFTMAALEDMQNSAEDAFSREHVTVWLIDNPEARKVSLRLPEGDWSCHRWTLDTQEDFDFLSRLFNRLPAESEKLTWMQLMRLVQDDPELLAASERKAHPESAFVDGRQAD